MSKKNSAHAQDFHALHSLLTHFNPSHKRTGSDLEMPEPEQCPKPHSVNTLLSNNHLNVPVSNPNDLSFRSQSSRADYTKRNHDCSKRYLDPNKRSIDYTKRSNSPFASPRTTPQEMERMLIIEQQIKVEKEKYKKLEKKYKELMATQSMNQNRFEEMVQEMQKKIEEKQGKKFSLEAITMEVKQIKGTVSSLMMGLDRLLDDLVTDEVTVKSSFK